MASNKSEHSVNTIGMLKKNTDSIPCRIELIRDITKGQKFEPLINFDNRDINSFLDDLTSPIKGGGEEDTKSCRSYDTRIVLKKKILEFKDVISNLGIDSKLEYVKGGSSGNIFHGISKSATGEQLEYAVKVVAFPKKTRYGDLYDSRRPENAELMMIKLLSYFIVNKETPHIVLPIGTFDTDIKVFTGLIDDQYVDEDNEKYKEFVESYKNGEYHNEVSILISEWANRGDLLDFIKKNYKQLEPVHWKVIFFQIISVLAVIQAKFPSFRHNDLKANNVLVHKISRQPAIHKYRIGKNIYKVPNIGYQIKLWDFDFACIPGVVDNIKVESKWTQAINVTPVQNRYYDVHYFFNTLIKKGFFHQFMTKDDVPTEAKEFVNRIVPKKYQTNEEYVHKRGRILVNTEYITPMDILMTDPYFEEFRTNIVDNKITKSSQNSHIVPDITKFLKESDNKNMKKPTNNGNANHNINDRKANKVNLKENDKSISKKNDKFIKNNNVPQ